MTATVRDQLLDLIKTSVQAAVGSTPVTREDPSAVSSEDCPTIDIRPDSDSPEPLGGVSSVDQWELAVTIVVSVAGVPASKIADPIVAQIHQVMCGPALRVIAASVKPGGTDFDSDDGSPPVGRTILRYLCKYATRRTSITQSM